MPRHWLAIGLCVVTLTMGGRAYAQNTPVGKKLIRIASELNSRLLGSPSIAAADLPTRVPIWQDAGLDGLSFSMASSDLSKGFHNMGAQWWNVQVQREYDEFLPDIQAFQNIRDNVGWGRLTDNFLHSTTAAWNIPRTVTTQDWFNDTHWQILTNNVGIQARIAKDIGFKGILLDAEQYAHHGNPNDPFYFPFDYGHYTSHVAQPLPFATVANKVFERGRQYAQTISAEYPGITLFLIPAIERPNGLLGTEQLYQHFFDGVLTGLGETEELVIGSESTYFDTGLADLALARNNITSEYISRSQFPQLLEDKVSFAAGIWTDAGPTWSDTDLNLNHRTPEEHQEAVHNSLAVSDEYAWSYGEKSFMLTTTPTTLMQEY